MIHWNLREHQVENKRGRRRQIDTEHFATIELIRKMFSNKITNLINNKMKILTPFEGVLRAYVPQSR